MAKILVVDDREQNRGVLTTLLQFGGHELIEASDGQEALAKTHERHPDLVITDILMPALDGWQFVRELRSDPDICKTPVIFYSALRLNAEARDAATALGVSQVLCKPIEPYGVMDAVEKALRQDGAKPETVPPPGGELDLKNRVRVLSARLWQKVQELETVKTELAERVADRTAKLESTNLELQQQIADRSQVEVELRQANEQLSNRALELEERTQDLRLLTEMSELLQACMTVEEAQQVTTQFTRNLFPSDSGALYLAREFGDMVEAFATWGPEANTTKQAFAPEECWALRRGRSHIVDDANAGAICAHLSGERPSGFICVPMMIQGHALGVLHVSWSEKVKTRDAQHVESTRRLAIALADNTALALSNVRLREKLKQQALRDPLTRLFNRRYLEESLDREVSRARRAGTQIGIILIDIDHFKHFNDSFGHQVGDEILRALGQYLQSRVRPEDIPTRYGGEEFALILPGASLSIIQARAESVRAGVHTIKQTSALRAMNIQEPITISLGIAVFPEHGTSSAGVLRAADDALYLAKGAGRDRVVVAGNDKEQLSGQQLPA